MAKSCKYNKYTTDFFISEVKKPFIKDTIPEDQEKHILDETIEKQIITELYKMFVHGTPIPYIEKSIPFTGAKERNIKFPTEFSNLINKYFTLPEEKIVFYGSLSLHSQGDITSDYDLMYLPNSINPNTSFRKEDFNKMYRFMNELRNKFDSKYKKSILEGLISGFENSEPSENYDTIFIHDYIGGQTLNLGKKKNGTKFKKLNASHFKLSIIPNIYIDKIKGERGRFCLLRIKFVCKYGGKFYTIPIVDLSYHFCEDDKNPIDTSNLLNFIDDKIMVKKDYSADLYSQLMKAYDTGDKDQIGKIRKKQSNFTSLRPITSGSASGSASKSSSSSSALHGRKKSSFSGGTRQKKTNKKTNKKK